MTTWKRAIRLLGGIALAVAMTAGATSVAFADNYSSASFTVSNPVIDNGGGLSSSAHFLNYSSFGQTQFEVESSSNFIDCNGFLYFESASKPTVTSLTAGNATVTLGWATSFGVCGNVITKYKIGVSGASGGPYVFGDEVAGNVLTFPKTGLTNCTPYYFVIQAISGTTVLATSAEVTGTPTNGSCSGGGGGGGGGGGCGLNCGDHICCINYENTASCPSDCPAPPPSPPAPVVTPPGPQCVPQCSSVSYDLYIVDPDGTERHSGTSWTHDRAIDASTVEHAFEDKGNDFDYNDVIVDVNKADCHTLSAKVVSIDAGWHHQIWFALYYDGVKKRTVMISPDSHQAAGSSLVIDGGTPDMCGGSNALTVVVSGPDGKPEPIREGDLIKADQDTVYYYGRDGKRHPFPHFKIYDSWYGDKFAAVRHIAPADLATIPVGPNVLYRPGSRLVKLLTDPKVYAVAAQGVLRWVTTGDVATSLFGTNWKRFVEDLNDAFFNDYVIGAPINAPGEYGAASDYAKYKSIDDNQKLPTTSPPQLPPVSSTVLPACTVASPFESILGVGVTDPQVQTLQQLLQCLGFFPAAVTPNGIYGAATESAVKDFQDANGLNVVGFLSNETRSMLNRFVLPPNSEVIPETPVPVPTPVPATPVAAAPTPTCTASSPTTHSFGAGSTDSQVLPMQQLLRCLGFFPKTVAPNGVMGPTTVASLKAFQTANGLTATGATNDATNTKLNSYIPGTPTGNTTTTGSASSSAPSPAPTACTASVTFNKQLQAGDEDPQALALQQLLRCLGFFPKTVAPNGVMGPTTVASLKAFQTAKGISATGIIGPLTQAALNAYR